MQESSAANALNKLPDSRLMVVLDWESLNLPAWSMKLVNARVMRAIHDHLGSQWDAELYRIYYQAGDEAARKWHEKYRGQHAIEQWRPPKHRGRRAIKDWDFRIRKNVMDWCVNDPEAKPKATTLVLVSRGGNFASMAERLDEVGVRMLLFHIGKPTAEARRVFGVDRMLEIEA